MYGPAHLSKTTDLDFSKCLSNPDIRTMEIKWNFTDAVYQNLHNFHAAVRQILELLMKWDSAHKFHIEYFPSSRRDTAPPSPMK